MELVGVVEVATKVIDKKVAKEEAIEIIIIRIDSIRTISTQTISTQTQQKENTQKVEAGAEEEAEEDMRIEGKIHILIRNMIQHHNVIFLFSNLIIVSESKSYQSYNKDQ